MNAKNHRIFAEQLNEELANILTFWKKNTLDKKYGGFVGRIDHFNNVTEKHSKGIILNTRILWTFSKANNFYQDSRYDDECVRAFDYLQQYFRDTIFGGVFWEVDFSGKATNKRKQVYAQAFCIYALAEYYNYSKNPKALTWAMELYRLLETKAYDSKQGGYIEAFDEKWQLIEDLRLSDKDLNAPKTTNTHLHILEAYTTLYDITQDKDVKASLNSLHGIFLNRIFSTNNHLDLFFSNDWKSISNEISFGHDIEAVWLLLLSARLMEDNSMIEKTEDLLLRVTKAFTTEALDRDFGVWNSRDAMTSEMDYDKHWWPQAEAMVGLIYVWEITQEESFINLSFQIWDFIKNHIIDIKKGEWYFRVNKEGVPYTTENKVGPWKCPYHNSRALIEVISKIRGNQAKVLV